MLKRVSIHASPTFRSILALVLREMSTTYGKSIGGYIWVVFEPILTITFLSLIFSIVLASPPLGFNFPLFYATGFLPFLLYRDTTNKVSAALQFSSSLLKYPSVTFIDAIIARLCLCVITGTFVFVIIMFGIVNIANMYISYEASRIFTAIFLTFLLGFGIGVLNSVLFLYSQDWSRIWSILNRPLFIVSGILFIFESVPDPFKDVLWYNPIIHIVGITRSGFYPHYEASYASILYVSLLGLTTLTMGLFLLRRWAENLLNK